jgi:hypothetical protein
MRARSAQSRNRLDIVKSLTATARVAVVSLCLLSPAIAPAKADARFEFGAQAYVTYDDNVTRAEGDANVLSDEFLGALATVSTRFLLTENIRLRLVGELGGEAYNEYSGLSFGSAGVRADVQYRATGAFSAPTLTLFGRAAYEEYESDLRDGYRYALGLSGRGDMTDRIAWFGAFTYNKRDGSSRVFDTTDFSVRGNLDYAFSRRNTLYTGLEYRMGDIVSTALPSLQYVDLSNNTVVPDDAFTDTTRYAYKLDATTWIFTLGYNFALNPKHSLDASWRLAYAEPNGVSSYSTYHSIQYMVNQLSLAYMVRF